MAEVWASPGAQTVRAEMEEGDGQAECSTATAGLVAL